MLCGFATSGDQYRGTPRFRAVNSRAWRWKNGTHPCTPLTVPRRLSASLLSNHPHAAFQSVVARSIGLQRLAALSRSTPQPAYGTPKSELDRFLAHRLHGRRARSPDSVEIEVILRNHLLPFKHEDVRLISACGVNGYGQRLKVGRKLDLLSVVDFAVALLVCQFQCVLVQPA